MGPERCRLAALRYIIVSQQSGCLGNVSPWWPLGWSETLALPVAPSDLYSQSGFIGGSEEMTPWERGWNLSEQVRKTLQKMSKGKKSSFYFDVITHCIEPSYLLFYFISLLDCFIPFEPNFPPQGQVRFKGSILFPFSDVSFHPEPPWSGLAQLESPENSKFSPFFIASSKMSQIAKSTVC